VSECVTEMTAHKQSCSSGASLAFKHVK